jgi:excisionase family DNA binding protein
METLTISVNSAKAALGLGHTKIYELINDGTLQSVRVGRRRLIKAESVRALVGQAA